MKADRDCIEELKRKFPNEINGRRFSKIAVALGVNRGLVSKVFDGVTRSNKLRLALGMSCLKVEVESCECGRAEGHTIRRCKVGLQIVRLRKSSQPEFLKFIQEVGIPFLRERETR